MKNAAAQALGRMARGVPKRYSTEEIARRTERLKMARAAKKRMDRARKLAKEFMRN